MSYNTIDQSVESGMPVELYKFNRGIQEWNYTSNVDTVMLLSVPYEPANISRSEITQSGEVSKDSITLKFPRDHGFVADFIGVSPDQPTILTIFRGHLTDADNEFAAYWKGRILSSSAAGSEVTLNCESVFTSLRRSGLRARYQLTCRHSLYSSACGVIKAAYATPAYIQSVNAHVVVNNASGSTPDGTFTGGMIELESGAMRFIVNHVGSALYLSRPFVENINGTTVNIFPGCDHLKSTCQSKFGNLLNFGGFPYIPSLNPFGGSSIV